jgi:hypothetical protein
MMDKKLTKKNLGPRVVTLSIILMAIGFIFLIQPFTISLYTIGFPIILVGVICINVGAHL